MAKLPDNTPIIESDSSSFMQRKILGMPAPLFLGVVAIVAFILYRHYKSTGNVASPGTAAPDPNAVDPNTGLTYGAEENAALGLQGQPNPNGTGTSGVGGLSASDLASLLQSLPQGSTTNYYYGSGGPSGSGTGGGDNGAGGAGATPTSTQPGNGNITGFSPQDVIDLFTALNSKGTATSTGAATGGNPNGKKVAASHKVAATNEQTAVAAEGFTPYPSLSEVQLSVSPLAAEPRTPLPSATITAPPSHPGGYPEIQFGTPAPARKEESTAPKREETSAGERAASEKPTVVKNRGRAI